MAHSQLARESRRFDEKLSCPAVSHNWGALVGEKQHRSIGSLLICSSGPREGIHSVVDVVAVASWNLSSGKPRNTIKLTILRVKLLIEDCGNTKRGQLQCPSMTSHWWYDIVYVIVDHTGWVYSRKYHIILIPYWLSPSWVQLFDLNYTRMYQIHDMYVCMYLYHFSW